MLRPDVVIFLTRPVGNEDMSSYMAAVNLDGSDYRLLDGTAAPVGLPALSPDGSTIAYDPAGRPWLYHWDTGSAAFTPADYGLQTAPENYGLSSPAWSPTGQYLAWMASGDLDGSGQPQGGVVIFDLQGSAYRLIHSYEPAGSGGGFLSPAWSPDGNWLVVFDSSLSQPGLWLMHPDGSGAMLAYSPGTARSVLGLQALWSPDGQRLLAVDPNAEGGLRLALTNLTTGQTEPSPLPPGAIPLARLK